MGKWMDGYLSRLKTLNKESLAGGGEERIEVQHSLGKLTARERIDRLADPGSFEELGSLVRNPYGHRMKTPKPGPGDGVAMGLAQINGRQVMVYSMDFTVMSGAIGDQGAWKIAELVQMAGQERLPLIGMIDSAGSRIGFKGGFTGLDGMGRLVRNYCLYSGIIPQITLLLGPCTGPLAQIPVLSDVLIMNETTGFLWLGGDIASE
ncbi:MAG: propionyl-CoA carboxylase, partial [Candidatus Hydrogenedentes bacterium]|nr:propionyl-CoA carboxylase [Candidatus Hydrogenedentota bacterium]